MKLHVLCFSAVLLLCLLVSKTSQEGAPIPESCLRTTDTKVRVQLLASYFIQRKPLYSVEAVRFLTVKGITICSDPNSPWAKKAMAHLDKKTHTNMTSAKTEHKKHRH
nr:monocyte chemotactic protein 1B-like [Misgurnus anguillicaudatus]